MVSSGILEIVPPTVHRPDYVTAAEPWFGKPVIKVLVGLRRSGKSVLLHQIAARYIERGTLAERVHLFDMERMANAELRTAEALHARLRDEPAGVVLIDEVQEVEGWERLVASLLAEGWDVWLTGSNAHLLSSELATLLTGRYVELPVFPLSFVEFRAFRPPATIEREDLELFLSWGGLPGLHALDLREDLCREYLRAVFESILLKDVVARFAVRNVPLLERLTRFVASSVGSPLSALSIVRFLKSQRQAVTVETVQGYLSHLESALLIHGVRRWDIRGKRHLEIAEKHYLGDTGLFVALLDRPGDINAVLENLVFLELKRRGYRVSVGRIGELEIDFVGERKGETVYVQVAYLLAEPSTVERELRPLRAVADHHPKVLLTMDRHSIVTDDGVRHLSLDSFLFGAPLSR